MRRNTGMHPMTQAVSADAAADAPDELARRRHFGTPALLDAAGQAFPAAGVGNVPSLREIQRALRIGQGKAQQVQAHLAGLSGGRGIGEEEPPMTYDDSDNDGRFPDDSRVEVCYPRTRQEEHGDRAAWPWLPGSIVEQCGPDEWRVCVQDRDVAVLRDSRPAPKGTASRNLYYPMCFRDSSEIRRGADG